MSMESETCSECDRTFEPGDCLIEVQPMFVATDGELQYEPIGWRLCEDCFEGFEVKGNVDV